MNKHRIKMLTKKTKTATVQSSGSDLIKPNIDQPRVLGEILISIAATALSAAAFGVVKNYLENNQSRTRAKTRKINGKWHREEDFILSIDFKNLI